MPFSPDKRLIARLGRFKLKQFDFYDERDLAAVKATLEPFAKYGKKQSVVRQVFNVLAAKRALALKFIDIFKQLESVSEIEISNEFLTLVSSFCRSYYCAPEFVNYAYDEKIKIRRCSNYRICPWCFARKFYEIYDTVKRFDEVSYSHAVLVIDPNEMTSIVKSVSRALLRTWKPSRYVFAKRMLVEGFYGSTPEILLVLTLAVEGKQVLNLGERFADKVFRQDTGTGMDTRKFIHTKLPEIIRFEPEALHCPVLQKNNLHCMEAALAHKNFTFALEDFHIHKASPE